MRTSGRPLSCSQRRQRAQQPARSGSATRSWITSRPTHSSSRSPILDRRDGEVVDRAVLEAGRAGGEVVAVGLDRRDRDRPASEPRPAQLAQRPPPCDQRADAGRVAEHLVEGKGHEVRVPPRRDRGGWSGRTPPRPGARPNPRACARSIQSSGCCTPEKFDCAGKANRLLRVGSAGRSDSAMTRLVHPHVGRVHRDVDRPAHPRARANSRMPFTELWLSNVRRKGRPAGTGTTRPPASAPGSRWR